MSSRASRIDNPLSRTDSEVIGHKEDTPAQETGSAYSLAAYAKGLISLSARLVETKLTPNTPSGNTDLFVVSGVVRLLSLVGVVRNTAFEAPATSLQLKLIVDELAARDLCAAADAGGKAVGTVLGVTGLATDALLFSATGSLVVTMTPIIIVPDVSAVIRLTSSAANAGQTRWYARYEPLSRNARIAAAF